MIADGSADREVRNGVSEMKRANSSKTARRANSESVVLNRHAPTQDDPVAFSTQVHGLAGIAKTHPKPPGSSFGRRSTATLSTAPTARTARNSSSSSQPRSTWQLRELILPLPNRKRRPRRTIANRSFYPALVEYIYSERYATAWQLQRRFPQWLSSRATTHRHLTELLDGGLIATANVRSTSPNFPAVYFVTRRGLNFVGESYSRFGVTWKQTATEERKSRGLALDSILHEIAVTELDLGVQLAAEQRPDVSIIHTERRYFRADRRLKYHQGQRVHHVIPDSGFLPAIEDKGHRQLLPLHLVELENGTHTVAQIRQKLKSYRDWYVVSGEEYLGELYAQHGHSGRQSSFRLLIVSHDKYSSGGDERQLIDLLMVSLELPRLMRDRIWLASASDLDASDIDSPVWFRVRDARRWLSDYETAIEDSGRGPAMYAKQRQFLVDRLARMPRHSLFPRPN